MFNYSGSAGFCQSHLHSVTFDKNTPRLTKQKYCKASWDLVCVCRCALMGLCGTNVWNLQTCTLGLQIKIFYFEPPLPPTQKGSSYWKELTHPAVINHVVMLRLSSVTSGWSQLKSVMQSLLTSMESSLKHQQVFQVRHIYACKCTLQKRDVKWYR